MANRLAILLRLWLVLPAGVFVFASPGRPAVPSPVLELKEKVQGATYSRWLCYTRLIDGNFGKPNGCTWNEYSGNNWHRWEQGAAHRFDFPEDETVRFVSIAFAGSSPEISLIGTPTKPWHIEWECPVRDGALRLAPVDREPAWVRLSEDLASLVFTCGVTHPAAYPLARLQYAWFVRN